MCALTIVKLSDSAASLYTFCSLYCWLDELVGLISSLIISNRSGVEVLLSVDFFSFVFFFFGFSSAVVAVVVALVTGVTTRFSSSSAGDNNSL